MHRLGAVLAMALAAVICYDAGGRLLLNRPLAGTAEVAATGMVLLTFLQVPYAILRKKLLRVTFLRDLLGPLGRGVLDVLAYSCGAAFFLALFVTAWEPTLHALRIGEFEGTDAFRIPTWPLRVATTVLWLVAALVCLRFVVLAASGRVAPGGDGRE